MMRTKVKPDDVSSTGIVPVAAPAPAAAPVRPAVAPAPPAAAPAPPATAPAPPAVGLLKDRPKVLDGFEVADFGEAVFPLMS